MLRNLGRKEKLILEFASGKHEGFFSGISFDRSVSEMEDQIQYLNGEIDEVRDYWGNTPLHLALQRGSLQHAEILIKNGATLAVRNNESKTPIDCADTLSVDALKKLENMVEKFNQQTAELGEALRNNARNISRAMDDLTLAVNEAIASVGKKNIYVLMKEIDQREEAITKAQESYSETIKEVEKKHSKPVAVKLNKLHKVDTSKISDVVEKTIRAMFDAAKTIQSDLIEEAKRLVASIDKTPAIDEFKRKCQEFIKNIMNNNEEPHPDFIVLVMQLQLHIDMVDVAYLQMLKTKNDAKLAEAERSIKTNETLIASLQTDNTKIKEELSAQKAVLVKLLDEKQQINEELAKLKTTLGVESQNKEAMFSTLRSRSDANIAVREKFLEAAKNRLKNLTEELNSSIKEADIENIHALNRRFRVLRKIYLEDTLKAPLEFAKEVSLHIMNSKAVTEADEINNKAYEALIKAQEILKKLTKKPEFPVILMPDKSFTSNGIHGVDEAKLPEFHAAAFHGRAEFVNEKLQLNTLSKIKNIRVDDQKLADDRMKFASQKEDKFGRTPFMLAVANGFTSEKGKPSIAKTLLKKCSANVNEIDKNGQTALMLAIRQKQHDGVGYLLRLNKENHKSWMAKITELSSLINPKIKESDFVAAYQSNKTTYINKADKAGLTPLMLAVIAGDITNLTLILNEIVRVNNALFDAADGLATKLGARAKVLAHLIDVNAKDTLGKTALHWACLSGNKEVLQILLHYLREMCVRDDRTVDVESYKGYLNAQDAQGRTPLMLAALSGHDEVVKILLPCQGIDVNVRDNSGYYARDLSALLRKKYNKEIEKLSVIPDSTDVVADLQKFDTASKSYAALVERHTRLENHLKLRHGKSVIKENKDRKDSNIDKDLINAEIQKPDLYPIIPQPVPAVTVTGVVADEKGEVPKDSMLFSRKPANPTLFAASSSKLAVSGHDCPPPSFNGSQLHLCAPTASPKTI